MKFVLSPRCAAHRGDNFVIEYLDEIKTEFENTLACLAGAQMGLNIKNLRSKILRHTSFKDNKTKCYKELKMTTETNGKSRIEHNRVQYVNKGDKRE